MAKQSIYLISAIVVGILFVIFLIILLKKKRIISLQKQVQELERQRNLIVSTPIASELAKVDVIIKNELLLKKEIDIKLYNKIIKDNLTATIYNSCLNLISTRIRSTNEIKEYLNKKEIDLSTQEQVINNLVARGYLNDEIYTKCYITDKINLTNNGPYKIISELKKQKIEDELINKYLYNEENNILFA